jgi:20S proteasome alpha/beta subunit
MMMMSRLMFLLIQLVITQFLFFSININNSNNDAHNNVVHAAHSRRRPVYRRSGPVYDREITTFTEDGRLAQVEYGLEASVRGSTIGAIRIPSESLEGGEEGESCVCICIENSSFGKMHRIDDHIWMITAGLSGDARMLANRIRTECQNFRLQYGEPPTTKQAAKMTADFYHQLTRLGGCRPLGCTAILIGVSNEEYGGIAATRIFLADPGGGVEECQFCTAGAGDSRSNLGKELMNLVAQFDNVNNNNDSSKEKGKDDDTSVITTTTTTITTRTRIKKSITSVASKMAVQFLMKLDEAKGTTSSTTGLTSSTTTTSTKIDVWTIQPMKNRRGGMLATCYSGVQKDNIQDVFRQ